MKLLIALCAATAAAGCANPADEATEVGIANPASEHCIEVGGRLELRQETGGTIGYCHLPDGQVVEEWTLFRNSRNEADAD